MKTIYLDHQATTPTSASVIEVMRPFWSEKFGNPHSSEHITGMIASRHVENAKRKIADCLYCEPDEIIFTSGATEANNFAIYSLCALSKKRPEKQIIISTIEHKCVIESARHWSNVFGLDLKFVEVDVEGFVNISQLKDMLKTPTLFCSIMTANNEIGTIQNLNVLSETINKSGALFHTDAAQALKAKENIKITEHADMASFSGHKIGGPQGIGCLYVAAYLQDNLSPLMMGGGQQNGFRAGTLPLPLCVGLGQAFEDIASCDFVQIRQKRDMLFTSLQTFIDGVRLNGPSLEDRHASNLNIYFPNIESADLIASLQPHIALSSGSACGSGNIEPSYVLRALPTEIDVSRNSVRMSIYEGTTEQDIANAVNLIASSYQSLF